MGLFGKKALGADGESQAAAYLKKHGYKIRESNYVGSFGEADIIAEKDGIVVFVEVKTRSDAGFGRPAEAVTPAKQRTYIKLAKEYIVKKRLANTDIRFDIIEVLDGELNHIENAFTA